MAGIGRWLEEEGLTGIVTAKADRQGMPIDVLGTLEFSVSLVITLERREETGGTLRALRITKYRGSAHSLFVSRLWHGAVGLVWLGMARRHRRSESQPGCHGSIPCLAVVLSARQHGPAVRSARRLIGLQPGRDGREQTLSKVLAAIETHDADALVVDPVSALMRGGVADLGQSAARRLVEEAQARGMTAMLTWLVEAGQDPSLTTLSAVSSIVDAWIALGYTERGGERNRTLSIVKVRDSAHSNQTRKLIMSAGGCTLADVYTAGGEVPLGTARMEWVSPQSAWYHSSSDAAR